MTRQPGAGAPERLRNRRATIRGCNNANRMGMSIQTARRAASMLLGTDGSPASSPRSTVTIRESASGSRRASGWFATRCRRAALLRRNAARSHGDVSAELQDRYKKIADRLRMPLPASGRPTASPTCPTPASGSTSSAPPEAAKVSNLADRIHPTISVGSCPPDIRARPLTCGNAESVNPLARDKRNGYSRMRSRARTRWVDSGTATSWTFRASSPRRRS